VDGHPKSTLGAWRTYYQRSVAVPLYDFSFRQTTGEAVTARPSLVSFTSPPYLDFESWNDTGEFYDEEMTTDRSELASIATHGMRTPAVDLLGG